MELPAPVLPKTNDIRKCCGRDTDVGRVRVEVKLMSDPPRTADRYLYITRWQCMVYESHHGEVWETSDVKEKA